MFDPELVQKVCGHLYDDHFNGLTGQIPENPAIDQKMSDLDAILQQVVAGVRWTFPWSPALPKPSFPPRHLSLSSHAVLIRPVAVLYCSRVAARTVALPS